MKLLWLTTILAGVTTALPAIDIQRRKDGAIVANPGPVSEMVVTKETTLNGTHKGPTVVVPPPEVHINTIPLPLNFVNNFGGAINAYLVGKCPNNAVCFIKGDGSIVYPSSGGSAVPVGVPSDSVKIPIGQGQTLNMNLPTPIESARIYFAAGDLQFGMVSTPNGDGLVQPAPESSTDPSAGVNWGFVELNVGPDGTIHCNISYVDFAGLVLGMQLEDNNGPTQSARGLKAGSADAICNDLRAQSSKDGYPWGNMCVVGDGGSIVRVLSPNAYSAVDGGAFANYWSGYVDQVWARYASQPLHMTSTCTTSGDVMTCDGGDDLTYPKPSATDIWGCNGGPFANTGNNVHKANLAILCAAFHRSTLLLDGGDVQPSLPSSSYYTVDPTNYYSRSVHANEIDGKGYAFPYDDVNANGENKSGLLSAGDPKSLLIWIGGN